MRHNVNIGSQVANYLANCIAGLHIKTKVVSHKTKEEAKSLSGTPDRFEITWVYVASQAILVAITIISYTSAKRLLDMRLQHIEQTINAALTIYCYTAYHLLPVYFLLH